MISRFRPYVACAVLQLTLASCQSGWGEEPHLTGELVYRVGREIRALDLATRSTRVIFERAESIDEMAPLDRDAFIFASWTGDLVVVRGTVAVTVGRGSHPSYFPERGVLFYYSKLSAESVAPSLFRAELRGDRLENVTVVDPDPTGTGLPVVKVSETEGVYDKPIRAGSGLGSRLIKYNLETGEKSVLWTDPSGRAIPLLWRSATRDLLVGVGESTVALREGSATPTEIRGLRDFIEIAYLEDIDAVLGCRERHTVFPGPGISYELVLYDFATDRVWELGVKAAGNTRDSFVR